jgi:hypothetical protein
MKNVFLLFVSLFLVSFTFGGIFIPNVDLSEPYAIIEGRASFSQEPYWMVDEEDEFALFYDGVCVGSTNKVNPLVSSHYDEMYVNIDKLDISRLTAKAYSSSTETIWDADIMGYSFESSYYGRDYHIDIRASGDTGQIPEPSSIILLSAGILYVFRSPRGPKLPKI